MKNGEIQVSNYAVILAGGTGSRMGNVDKPKQFIEVYGKPIIAYTLETFSMHMEIDKIIIVTLKEWQDDVRALIRKFELSKVVAVLTGGDTRQQSVYEAIKYLKDFASSDDIVVVHDAVRPLVSQKIISENIRVAKQHGAVDTAIPSADTIVHTQDMENIKTIPNRDQYFLGQTPQTFHYSILQRAHEVAMQKDTVETTDDCKLILQLGHPVKITLGDKLNFKITTFEDLSLFKALIKLGKIEVI